MKMKNEMKFGFRDARKGESKFLSRSKNLLYRNRSDLQANKKRHRTFYSYTQSVQEQRYD